MRPRVAGFAYTLNVDQYVEESRIMAMRTDLTNQSRKMYRTSVHAAESDWEKAGSDCESQRNAPECHREQ